MRLRLSESYPTCQGSPGHTTTPNRSHYPRRTVRSNRRRPPELIRHPDLHLSRIKILPRTLHPIRVSPILRRIHHQLIQVVCRVRSFCPWAVSPAAQHTGNSHRRTTPGTTARLQLSAKINDTISWASNQTSACYHYQTTTSSA